MPLQPGLPHRTQPALIHRRCRVAFEFQNTSLTNARMNAASGRTLATYRSVIHLDAGTHKILRIDIRFHFFLANLDIHCIDEVGIPAAAQNQRAACPSQTHGLQETAAAPFAARSALAHLKSPLNPRAGPVRLKCGTASNRAERAPGYPLPWQAICPRASGFQTASWFLDLPH